MPVEDSRPGRNLFISYASRDRQRVIEIVAAIESLGVTVWRDGREILGGENYGVDIVRGIQHSQALVLMCSAASMRSRNVKQEIQLAWCYGKPYLPLLLDDSITQQFPEQVQYWLEGVQWVDVRSRPTDAWLPEVKAGLQSAKVLGGLPHSPPEIPPRIGQSDGLESLLRLASYTDQIWPVPADAAKRGAVRGALRGLGAPQPSVQHAFRLGSRVRLMLELDRDAHLTLIDLGPEGICYGLCPSVFASEARLPAGTHVLPQPSSPYESFLITGRPGREQLIAILSQSALDLPWGEWSAERPARELTERDLAALLEQLRALPGDSWTSVATYFEITA
jgi:hypothetical protein